MSLENREREYGELLASVRRLTVRVLDELDEGSGNKSLDHDQKRLLSSTGTRLLRLWTVVLRQKGSPRTVEEVGRIAGSLGTSKDLREEHD